MTVLLLGGACRAREPVQQESLHLALAARDGLGGEQGSAEHGLAELARREVVDGGADQGLHRVRRAARSRRVEAARSRRTRPMQRARCALDGPGGSAAAKASSSTSERSSRRAVVGCSASASISASTARSIRPAPCAAPSRARAARAPRCARSRARSPRRRARPWSRKWWNSDDLPSPAASATSRMPTPAKPRCAKRASATSRILSRELGSTASPAARPIGRAAQRPLPDRPVGRSNRRAADAGHQRPRPPRVARPLPELSPRVSGDDSASSATGCCRYSGMPGGERSAPEPVRGASSMPLACRRAIDRLGGTRARIAELITAERAARISRRDQRRAKPGSNHSRRAFRGARRVAWTSSSDSTRCSISRTTAADAASALPQRARRDSKVCPRARCE